MVQPEVIADRRRLGRRRVGSDAGREEPESMRRAVIVMARGPRPGEVKTRLIPALGPGGAAALYRCFVLDVLDTVADAPLGAASRRFVFVQPPEAASFFEEAAGARFEVRGQTGATLAERMIAAFASLFAEGFEAVVMRNSDSPTLPARLLEEAFVALERGADVVVGPDRGGGYCLVGLRTGRPDLFRGVAMGGSTVFEETTRRAQLFKLKVATLAPCLDVDTPEDLERLRQELDPANRVERATCERTEALLAATAGRPGRKGVPLP